MALRTQVCLLFLSSLARLTAVGSDSTYIAAVYEHRVVLNPEPRVPLSRRAALLHLQQNLDVYKEQAARAARQGAQILVFPEDGLHGFNFTRSSIYGYLETVPDPQESWNPCVEPGRHPDTEVQQRLSCMARQHKLYLVANMATVQFCSVKTLSCPPDGRWQFNTNVVFSADGLLVARYHKQNLYFEEAFDTPPQVELSTFETPFAGKFGLIICFDILFREPTVMLLEKGVRQLVFPTAWMNQLPLLDAIQFQRALSLGANVTLLAANICHEHLRMTGSGLYSPWSAVYHHAQRGVPEEGRLLVAKLPVLEPPPDSLSWDINRDILAGACHTESCSTCPSDTFISYMMHDPFTFVLLALTHGELSVCDATFCCQLQYRRSPAENTTELYALGAFAGTHIVNGNYSLQVCALVKCAGTEPSSCGQYVEKAETKMDFVLEGEFSTRYVYPSILASTYVLEQPDHLERTARGRVTMKHFNMTAGLLTACLYGRMYDLDPE